MKASPLLRAWLRGSIAAGVRFALRHQWTGWNEAKRLTFAAPDGSVTVDADATVLALGGASWPRLGSDGGWAGALMQAGIAISPLRPANCGFVVAWSDHLKRHAGQPLKRIALSFGDHVMRGEAIITENGSRRRRDLCAVTCAARCDRSKTARPRLHIALRPDIWAKELERRLSAPRGKQSISTFLRKALSLSPAEIGLLQEVDARETLDR